MTVPTYQYRTVVTVAPTVEPVTLAEAKLHLRVDHTAEDDYITSLIIAGREWAEGVTRRAFISRTVRLSLDEFPTEIKLPFGKTQSVSTFAYTDADGNAATLASGSTYTLDSDSEPARLLPYYNTDWPSVYGIPNAIQITYVVGYGAAATAVPTSIKQAILLAVGHWYEHREMVADAGVLAEVPLAAQALLTQYRILEFF